MLEQKSIMPVLSELSVVREDGLSSEEASERLKEYGRNEFEEKKKKTKLYQ